MNRSSNRYAAFAALFLSILMIVSAPLALGQEPATEQVQQQSTFPKPIPRGWKIVIAASAVLMVAIALFFSVRAWHAGNLFDREYHFRPAGPASLRLGASKCGGCIATIKFRDRGDPIDEAS